MTDTIVIEQTSNWINSVVIGCNFCPFAAKAVNKKTVHYFVLTGADTRKCLETLIRQLHYLDETESIETTFIILPNGFENFYTYLDLVEKAEKLLSKEGYDGVYQIASFHPEYCFAGADENDAANFTNRSIYPMLHILREESISNALENFPDPDDIPQRNIDFAQQKGLIYMQMLRNSCM